MAINHGLATSPPMNNARVQRTISFRDKLRVNNVYAAIPGAITASPMSPFVRIAKATETDMPTTQIQRRLASIAASCSQKESTNKLINGTNATSCAGPWVKTAGSTSVSEASAAYMADSASNIRRASNVVVAQPKRANRNPGSRTAASFIPKIRSDTAWAAEYRIGLSRNGTPKYRGMK